MHRNPNPHMYCRDCGHWFWYGESFFYPAIEYGWLPSPQRICQKCSERENMSNIKITAEVDGKQVPLKTVSTETFEAIKALEKSKKIPVARLAINRDGESYLLFNPARQVLLDAGFVHVLDLKRGVFVNNWELKFDDSAMRAFYRNVKSL